MYYIQTYPGSSPSPVDPEGKSWVTRLEPPQAVPESFPGRPYDCCSWRRNPECIRSDSCLKTAQRLISRCLRTCTGRNLCLRTWFPVSQNPWTWFSHWWHCGTCTRWGDRVQRSHGSAQCHGRTHCGRNCWSIWRCWDARRTRGHWIAGPLWLLSGRSSYLAPASWYTQETRSKDRNNCGQRKETEEFWVWEHNVASRWTICIKLNCQCRLHLYIWAHYTMLHKSGCRVAMNATVTYSECWGMSMNVCVQLCL